MRLEDRVALITGGARGMGAAEARLFAREGAKVVIGDVLEAEGKQVEAEINQSGARGPLCQAGRGQGGGLAAGHRLHRGPGLAGSTCWSITPES